MSEIKIHKSLNHSNVIRFEHFFEDEENTYILLEICQNQTMNELLRRRKRLTELEVQCYFQQMIAGVKYLHQNRVIHRDLKLGNLFLTDKMELKLADFGLATKLEFEGDRKRTVCGTPNYIAPEILEGKHGHSYEVDIWSLGVILFTLLLGKPPFETSSVKTTYKRIKANAYDFPDHIIISNDAKDLIMKMLTPDPLHRPTLIQILNHSFISGKNIPKLLPTGTLSCPPSASYVKQYNPQAIPTPNERLSSTGPLKFLLLSDNNSINQRDNKGLVHVKKYIDYSSKYGLGYLLSNGCIGILFNDLTKVLVHMDRL
jgi:polo-like kinase 1